ANATPFLRKDGRGMGIAVRNYNELDGLQSREFNEKAACKTRQGELVFGGANGFNIFSPENIDRNPGVTKVLLTDFQISDHSLRPGEPVSDRVVLERSMTETCALTLEHGQNVFSLGFAALNFFHPEKNVYQYTLEGFNQGWYTADNKTRKVTYTNLDPGNYVFRVRVADETGAWVESKGLKICVQPPFWRSTLAYVVYFLLIAGALFLARWIMLDRERMNFRIEQERLEAQRTHELDLLKIKFLTNISHEFRTPLSLIMTPIERLMHAAKEPGERVQLALVFRNAKRLLNQVNQLLDFKKLEVAEARFVPAQSDLVSFIREISHSFSEMSGQKHIDLSFNSRIDSLQMIFDQEKMSRVMYNLLSNAFKFTPEHGRVSVTLERPPVAGSSEYAEIRVSDTGIGIPRAAQRKIFDRFYQHTLPDSVVHQGSGIGLSITREFVKLHEGTIRVESEEHKGSTFIIRLPVRRNPDSEEVQEMPGEAVAGETAASVAEKKTAAREGEKKYSILIVEDDADFRAYLKNTLREQYEMLEAPDGKSAWNIVLEQTPDLVVSDVMMPVMDGIELCRRIKADRRISHIPVILLTARTAEEQQLLGYETGADAYITKPFQFDILSVRIHNLIRQKEQLRRKMQRFVDVEPSEIKIDSLDEQLVRKAIDLVEQNIANADFSVEELSHALAMSRVYLYKKLLALTGKTPIEFIRVMRLKRAAQLLEKSQLTVAEVAYKVGFNNPKYFAKYFKEEYGMLPTAYQKKTRNAG
ncbi:MAG: response regulator, partial [Saprospiraceae bacterium]|nr:response regulator [Saprospiraceae bacterium]